MRKAFYIVIETTQSDVQCIREFEHAVGEITSVRPEIIKVDPALVHQHKNEIVSSLN